MIVYRVVRPDEMPGAVELWNRVFGVEKPFFQSLLDGGDDDDVSLGAFDGERLVSSVHVFMRHFRDRDGAPLKVGGIGSVSTDPDARRQGHSARLLEMAISEMEQRECVWSYLGTGVHDHYARHGWRTVSTPEFVGALRESSAPTEISPVTVDADVLDSLAAIHGEHTRLLPMANARSAKMWAHAARYRMTCPGDEVLVTSGRDAYIVCWSREGTIQLTEAAGEEQGLRGLIRARLESAASRGIHNAICALSEACAGFDEFKRACREVHPAESRAWMLRPIAGRISWPELFAIHGDPWGRRSDVDNF